MRIKVTAVEAQRLLNEILGDAREGSEQESSSDVGDFILETLDKGLPGWRSRSFSIKIEES